MSSQCLGFLHPLGLPASWSWITGQLYHGSLPGFCQLATDSSSALHSLPTTESGWQPRSLAYRSIQPPLCAMLHHSWCGCLLCSLVASSGLFPPNLPSLFLQEAAGDGSRASWASDNRLMAFLECVRSSCLSPTGCAAGELGDLSTFTVSHGLVVMGT